MKKALCLAALLAFSSAPVRAQAQPWMDTAKSPEDRAHAAVAAMTLEEKLTLVMGYSEPDRLAQVPDSIISSAIKADVKAHHIEGAAGYVPGIPRLGLPPQWQTDASIGVRVEGMERTALPSSLATAASFDPAVPYSGGVMIAREARASGFNTFLAGGANLAREPRCGRNFEYVGEDPWLAGEMAGSLIAGIQSVHMVSTMKHWAVNDVETQRTTLDVTISPEAMHQSDLLAFEFVLEKGDPGSVMCAYNLVNGRWACENEYLQQKVLKQDWGFKGFIMSDWGAVHSTLAPAIYGLDQMTGFPCCGDHKPWFNEANMKAAMQSGDLTQKRVDEMAYRILWPFFAKGVIDDPVRVGPIDFKKDADISQDAAEQSLTLLKNEGNLLPLKGAKTIAVIGGHADKGVLSGGGSSSVLPVGGNVVPDKSEWPGPTIYMPSSPLAELKKEMPKTRFSFSDGEDLQAAVAAAAKADVAIVFVTDWRGEELDGTLDLKGNQNELVGSVARSNPKTVVVIESSGAVLMPWLEEVPAVLEAWYPGIRGGAAIARILTGKVNPSGHLPITFPVSEDQLPHVKIPGFGKPGKLPVHITYTEGEAVGYKWYDVTGKKPLFAFGHGLCYTTFAVSDGRATLGDDKVTVTGRITNTGKVQGKGVAMAFVKPADYLEAGWDVPRRLVGFTKKDLAPGSSQTFELKIDARLLATFEVADNSWHIKAGTYHILLGQAADDVPVSVDITLTDKAWSAVHSR